MDPKLKQFFSKAGVSERELQDKDTRDFIYDFIDKHGGIEAALLEVDRKASSNKAAAAAAAAASASGTTPAPAPPPRQSSIARPPPPSKVFLTANLLRVHNPFVFTNILTADPLFQGPKSRCHDFS